MEAGVREGKQLGQSAWLLRVEKPGNWERKNDTGVSFFPQGWAPRAWALQATLAGQPAPGASAATGRELLQRAQARADSGTPRGAPREVEREREREIIDIILLLILLILLMLLILLLILLTLLILLLLTLLI